MSTTQTNQLTLISQALCPFVQRAVIAPEELGLEYKRTDIDLNNKLKPPRPSNLLSDYCMNRT
ncbi:MAG: glutathione S-transferase [Granulosicoccus sp.]|jgi:glutathione S-transferase